MKKPCSSCRTVKPVEAFHKNKSKPTGYCSRCIECNTKYHAQYQKTEKWNLLHRKIQAKFIAKHKERETIYRLAAKVPLGPCCERCGTSEKRLVRHHPDYSKPQDVITYCDKCHRAVHKELLNVKV